MAEDSSLMSFPAFYIHQGVVPKVLQIRSSCRELTAMVVWREFSLVSPSHKKIYLPKSDMFSDVAWDKLMFLSKCVLGSTTR